MPTRRVLNAVAFTLAAVLCGCGGGGGAVGEMPQLLTMNADGTYRACLENTDVVALGGIIAAFTPDGSPAALHPERPGRVAEPVRSVVVERVRIRTEPGSVAPPTGVPLLQVQGLQTAFASPIAADYRSLPEFRPRQVTARPDGRLGGTNRLGWHSLAVPVRPIGDRLVVYDLALRYRVGGGEVVEARVGTQWSLATGATCAPYDTGRLESAEAEWATVFEAHDGEPWAVAGRLED